MLDNRPVYSEADFKVDIISYNEASSQQLFDIFWLCLLAYHEKDQDNHINMDVVSWHTKQYTLLYKIYEEKLFITGRGKLALLYNNHQLIAISGVHRSKADPYTFVGGTRSWVVPKYQGNLIVARYLIPEQVEAVKKMGGKAFLLTFNDGKKAVISDAQIPKFPETFKRHKYPAIFHDMYMWPDKVMIQGALQHVLVKELKKDYEPKF